MSVSTLHVEALLVVQIRFDLRLAVGGLFLTLVTPQLLVDLAGEAGNVSTS